MIRQAIIKFEGGGCMDLPAPLGAFTVVTNGFVDVQLSAALSHLGVRDDENIIGIQWAVQGMDYTAHITYKV